MKKLVELGYEHWPSQNESKRWRKEVYNTEPIYVYGNGYMQYAPFRGFDKQIFEFFDKNLDIFSKSNTIYMTYNEDGIIDCISFKDIINCENALPKYIRIDSEEFQIVKNEFNKIDDIINNNRRRSRQG